jgi:MYXO-CTERM domain-containing protein
VPPSSDDGCRATPGRPGPAPLALVGLFALLALARRRRPMK